MQMTNRKSGVELVLSQMANHAPQPLYDAVASRQIEHHLASTLPTHTLMQRAGMSIARLALALWPHAQTIWVACGPGNNGGDGFEAALHLHSWGKTVVLTWLGTVDASPPDALLSRQRALDAGICVTPNMPAHFDVCIDALWGLGRTGRASGRQSDLIPPQEIALAD